MQEMRAAKAGSRATARLKALFAAGALSLAVGGCGTAIETPLPDVKAAASTSLTQSERDKAVAELNRKRLTHEQDAEQQIEQAR
jgi:hypothetical protein